MTILAVVMAVRGHRQIASPATVLDTLNLAPYLPPLPLSPTATPTTAESVRTARGVQANVAITRQSPCMNGNSNGRNAGDGRSARDVEMLVEFDVDKGAGDAEAAEAAVTATRRPTHPIEPRT